MIVDASATLRALETYIGALERAADQALNEAQNKTLEHLRGTHRFKDRTGTLRASFQAHTPERFRRIVSTDVHYAKFVEFGTRFIRPRKFMHLARDYGESALVRALESHIGNSTNGS